MHWAEVLEAFDKVERVFQAESYADLPCRSLRKRIRWTSAILLLFALSEHAGSWASFLYDRIEQTKICHWEIGSYFFYLATTHLHQIYAELPVKVGTVIWAEYMNISFTFAWNFIDLFIIIVSIGVASKFDKINKRLEYFRERVSDGYDKELVNLMHRINCRLFTITSGKRFDVTTIKFASCKSLWTRNSATLSAWRVSMTCITFAFSFSMLQRENCFMSE